jgi:periplasmic divalent cation tolerance protein
VLNIHTTVPEDDADRIASELVENGVAACVNAYPVSSTYRWEGDVIKDDEVALDVKTALPYDEVRERIEALHPYDVPMVLRHDAEANDDYADWVRGGTRTDR